MCWSVWHNRSLTSTDASKTTDWRLTYASETRLIVKAHVSESCDCDREKRVSSTKGCDVISAEECDVILLRVAQSCTALVLPCCELNCPTVRNTVDKIMSYTDIHVHTRWCRVCRPEYVKSMCNLTDYSQICQLLSRACWCMRTVPASGWRPETTSAWTSKPISYGW